MPASRRYAAIRLLPGFAFELQLGKDRARAEISVVSQVCPALSRPAIDRKPAAYVAVVLAVHLAVWSAAVWLAPPAVEIVAKATPSSRRVRIVAHEHVEPPRVATPAASSMHLGASAKPSGSRMVTQRVAVGRPNQVAVETHSLAALARALDDIHIAAAVDAAGPLYVEDDAPRWGGAREFDPTTRPGFAAIATGKFATISEGRAAGDDYDPLAGARVAICDPRCTVMGALDRETIQQALASHAAAFAACGASGTTNELALEIDPRGVVLHASGSSDAGACVAQVARSIRFPERRGGSMASIGFAFN